MCVCVYIQIFVYALPATCIPKSCTLCNPDLAKVFGSTSLGFSGGSHGAGTDLLTCGWLSKVWSFFGYPKYQVPYYTRDPKTDHNFVKLWSTTHVLDENGGDVGLELRG